MQDKLAVIRKQAISKLNEVLKKAFADVHTPALPIMKSQSTRDGLLQPIRFGVFDINYPDGADVYAITRWGDLIYSFPEDYVKNPDKNKIINLDLPTGIFRDLTSEDLFIEHIGCLIDTLASSYNV